MPWAILRDAGHQVVFATEKAGTVPAADPRLLTGVLFGQLGAAAEARKLYYELTGTPEFGSTPAWADLDPAGFDGLILPGGHAPGMRQYLGSPVLSDKVGRFWRLAGRSGRSATASWCWPAPATRPPAAACWPTAAPPACRSTWSAAYLVTAWRLGRYYRTYPAYVEDEVRAALDDPDASSSAGRSRCPARYRDRRLPRLCRPRPQLRVGPLARRRLPLRPHASATCSSRQDLYPERTGLIRFAALVISCAASEVGAYGLPYDNHGKPYIGGSRCRDLPWSVRTWPSRSARSRSSRRSWSRARSPSDPERRRCPQPSAVDRVRAARASSPAWPTAALSGRRLARNSRAKVIRRKQRRMQIVAAAGIVG